MATKLVVSAMLVAVVLLIGGCSPEQSAGTFFRRDLEATAKGLGAELGEVKIGIDSSSVQFEQKAKGVEFNGWARIEYIVRCDESEDWVYVRMMYDVGRTDGRWNRSLYSVSGSDRRWPDYRGIPWGIWHYVDYYLPPCRLSFDPTGWDEKMQNRRTLEKWHHTMIQYQRPEPYYYLRGNYPIPLEIDRFQAQMLLLVGPSWPFVLERGEDLEKWFGRPLTNQDIEAFRTNPNLESEIVTMIAEQEARGGFEAIVSNTCFGVDSLAEFYGMSQSNEGRQRLADCTAYP